VDIDVHCRCLVGGSSDVTFLQSRHQAIHLGGVESNEVVGVIDLFDPRLDTAGGFRKKDRAARVIVRSVALP